MFSTLCFFLPCPVFGDVLLTFSQWYKIHLQLKTWDRQRCHLTWLNISRPNWAIQISILFYSHTFRSTWIFWCIRKMKLLLMPVRTQMDNVSNAKECSGWFNRHAVTHMWAKQANASTVGILDSGFTIQYKTNAFFFIVIEIAYEMNYCYSFST